MEYLHEAVRIDPAEPLAYAGLALGYLDIAHGPFNAGDAYVKAESVAAMPMWKPLYADIRHAEFVKRLNLPK